MVQDIGGLVGFASQAERRGTYGNITEAAEEETSTTSKQKHQPAKTFTSTFGLRYHRRRRRWRASEIREIIRRGRSFAGGDPKYRHLRLFQNPPNPILKLEAPVKEQMDGEERSRTA
jgi:hypothetical protein